MFHLNAAALVAMKFPEYPQIDMDAYLEESDLFEWIDVKRTGNDDYMLAAKCKVKADISIARAREDVCRIWEGSLRYSNFAEHSLEATPDGFVLHFVTTAPALGVVGSIECFKDKGEQTGCTERRDRVSVDNRTPLARRR